MPDAPAAVKDVAGQARAAVTKGIADALAEIKFPVDDDPEAQLASWDSFGAEANESTDAGESADAPAEGEESGKVQDPEVSGEAEPAETPAADVPESYWGVDLSDIPAEPRAEVIAHFEQQDSIIRKLQARLAKEPEKPALEAPVAPEEVTDADLLKAMGLNPESFEAQQAAPLVLPLARSVLALEERVEQLSQVESTRSVETAWNERLAALEESYGKLPGTRLEQLRYAVEENIASPAELYFELSAPIKKEVEAAAAAARREAAKREQAAGPKPRNVAAGESTIKKGMSLRDAVKAAALEAEKETGATWKGAMRRFIRVPDKSGA